MERKRCIIVCLARDGNKRILKGLYNGWMIVQPADEVDGEILCFMPSDEFDGSEYPELQFIKDYFTAEWEAGSLQEALDFINSN